MREIKFKGKSVVTGHWLYGSLINNAFFKADNGEPVLYILDTDAINYDDFVDIAEQMDFFEVDPETVGQFTGISDKNYEEIYEGDVINCEFLLGKRKAVVKFGEYEQDGSGGEYAPTDCIGFYADAINKDQIDEDGFKILSDYDYTKSLIEFDSIEVVGNIHDKGDAE